MNLVGCFVIEKIIDGMSLESNVFLVSFKFLSENYRIRGWSSILNIVYEIKIMYCIKLLCLY